MSNGLVTYHAEGGIAELTLTNPPANAYSHEMMLDLDEAILRARFDDAVHVIVVRGAGEKFFCAGADIKKLQAMAPEFKYNFCLHANETLCRLEQTPKLVIAAIAGHCVGGGLEVAMAADLRVARRGGGKLGLPEVNLGVLPGTGGTQRLLRLVPNRAVAIDLITSGRSFDFEEGQRLGLVNRVFEGDLASFDAQVRAFAAEFVPPARASKAVGLIKRAIQSGAETSLGEGLALERELQQQLFQSADAREGLEAYVGRRPAAFTGK
jgi:enoyl-CoA hydratase/carnithine racemase